MTCEEDVICLDVPGVFSLWVVRVCWAVPHDDLLGMSTRFQECCATVVKAVWTKINQITFKTARGTRTDSPNHRVTTKNVQFIFRPANSVQETQNFNLTEIFSFTMVLMGSAVLWVDFVLICHSHVGRRLGYSWFEILRSEGKKCPFSCANTLVYYWYILTVWYWTFL